MLSEELFPSENFKLATYDCRVYVLELDPSIVLEKDFREANASQAEDDCFYVGYSAHSTECRWNQHQHATTLNSVTCICDVKRGQIVTSKGSAYAMKYGLWIADKSFQLNRRPFRTTNQAKQAEQRHAELLRSEGYGDWQK